MLRLEDISADTLTTPWQKQTLPQGLLAMLAIGLALTLGSLSGHPAAGAIAAGAAFTVGFAVFHPAVESPLVSMIVVTAGLASATFAGSLSAKWTPVALAVVGIAALNYGLLSGLGATAGWIGQQSAVFLVVATYFPNGRRYAAGRALMVLLGGLMQAIIYTAFRLRSEHLTLHTLTRKLHQRTSEYATCIHKHMAWTPNTVAYTIKLILIMLIGTAIYRVHHLRNGYWIPMTALLVLKPQWTGTVSRSLARILGTVAGAAIAWGLAHLHAFPNGLILALIIVCCVGCYALQAVNYALFSLFITLYIVFLFRFGGFSETAAAHLRLLNTALGGALAFSIDLLWLLLGSVLTHWSHTEPTKHV